MNDELALALDPRTPPEVLKKLLNGRDNETTRAAMRNPNLSRDTLFLFAIQFPEEFLQNPALPLMLLEQPPDALELTMHNAPRIFSCECQEGLLQMLLLGCHTVVQGRIALHPQTRPRVLRLLSTSEDVRVRAATAQNPQTPSDAVEVLSQDLSWVVRRYIAKRPDLSEQLRERLSRDNDPKVLASIAQNPSLSIELLSRLAGLNYPKIRQAIAQNPTTTPELLALVAERAFLYEETPQLVAKHPAASPELLELLSHAKRVDIRLRVAENENTPLEALRRLQQDKSANVAESAKKNLEKRSTELTAEVDPG